MIFTSRAITFAAALAEHIAAGCPGVTAEQFEARLAICQECPHYDWGRVKCTKCGCPLRRKAAWARSKCPLGPPKWGPVD